MVKPRVIVCESILWKENYCGNRLAVQGVDLRAVGQLTCHMLLGISLCKNVRFYEMILLHTPTSW